MESILRVGDKRYHKGAPLLYYIQINLWGETTLIIVLENKKGNTLPEKNTWKCERQ